MFTQKNAVSVSRIAAKAGMKNLASHLVESAFASRKARQKHIAELPEAEEKFRFVAVFSANGIMLAEDYPKGEGIRPITRGEVFAFAWAAAKLALGEIEVDETRAGNVRISFTGDNKVAAWISIDPRRSLVKRVYHDKRGFTRQEVVKSASLTAKIGAAARLALDEQRYGVRLFANSREVNFIDALFSKERVARYWAGAAARSGFRQAVAEADGDVEKAAKAMRMYRIVYRDGHVAEKRLTEKAAEVIKKYAAEVVPV